MFLNGIRLSMLPHEMLNWNGMIIPENTEQHHAQDSQGRATVVFAPLCVNVLFKKALFPALL